MIEAAVSAFANAGSTPSILAFAWVAFVVELTPGPNMTYLALLSLGSGRTAGLSAVAGVALGLLVMGATSALGLAALISQSPPLYEILRWGGVAYLLWLAWEGWNDGGKAGPDAEPSDDHDLRFFRQGLITNLLNPKAAIFYIGVLPLFVDPSQNIMAQTLTLTVVYVAIATAIHLAIVLLASNARVFLANRVGTRRLSRTLAILLATVAIWLAFATRRT